MNITLALSPEIETRLRAAIARHDVDTTRYLLVEAVTPTVEALLEEESAGTQGAAFEALLDQVADTAGQALPSLSEYAVSREGIYEDHP